MIITSNEIELIFRNKGHEKGTKEVCFLLAEAHNDLERTVTEFGKLVAQMASVVKMQNTVMDAMKDIIDKNKKQDDDPSSTRGMIEQ